MKSVSKESKQPVQTQRAGAGTGDRGGLLMAQVCDEIQRKVPPDRFLALEQGPANYSLRAECGPPLVFYK